MEPRGRARSAQHPQAGRRAIGWKGALLGCLLALLLSSPGPGVRELEAKFPTAALAILALPGPGWTTLGRGSAELIEFIRPRDLER